MTAVRCDVPDAAMLPARRFADGTAWDAAHRCALLLSDAAADITGTEPVVDSAPTGRFV